MGFPFVLVWGWRVSPSRPCGGMGWGMAARGVQLRKLRRYCCGLRYEDIDKTASQSGAPATKCCQSEKSHTSR
eukprot:3117323-Rhodomonas_salina.1